jgi:aspartate beta-hydroxylase
LFFLISAGAFLNTQIENLARAAQQAMNQGRRLEAEKLWQQVIMIDPNHPYALASLGVHAYQRGELKTALGFLQKARLGLPRDAMVLMTTAVVMRDLGNTDEEDQLLTAVLDIDPYFLPALLSVGALIERTQGSRNAAQHYRNALKTAPPEPQWPPALRPQLVHAQKIVEAYGLELSAYLEQALGTSIGKLPALEAQRWREVGAIVSGRGKLYPSVANQLQIPRLPAIPFFDRSMFQWVSELEAQTDQIREELMSVLEQNAEQFQPYVAYEAGTPVNQWQELNHSKRWSSYFLWRNGNEVIDNSKHCPKTAAALRQVNMPEMKGLCPNAMFSALAPKTHIPPHHGETNARLVVHLPLIVPENCSYRVGFERREWRVGEALIFDDTIEHEARNDSSELRVVLIFDTWNPLLSAPERELVQALNLELDRFHRREV